MKTLAIVLFVAAICTVSGLLPAALPQVVNPQYQGQQRALGDLDQPTASPANPFLQVGKVYEFTPASKWGVFQGKVAATRGEQWARVVEVQGEGYVLNGAMWVNLNHIAFIADAAPGGVRNRFDSLPKKQ
jgi:hypothetical protein